MDKKTQMYVGIAALAVVGYLVYQRLQEIKEYNKDLVMETPTTMEVKEFAGMDYNTVVGDRKRMVGMVGFVAANKDVQDSGWVRGVDGSIAPTFFDVQSSGWVRGSMN